MILSNGKITKPLDCDKTFYNVYKSIQCMTYMCIADSTLFNHITSVPNPKMSPYNKYSYLLYVCYIQDLRCKYSYTYVYSASISQRKYGRDSFQTSTIEVYLLPCRSKTIYSDVIDD